VSGVLEVVFFDELVRLVTLLDVGEAVVELVE